MRPRDENIARLVEADVAVHAEPENQQIESARASDRLLVAPAFGAEIARKPIEEVDAPRVERDTIEEVAPHERAVASRIVPREADEFIEVERGDLRKIKPLVPMHPHQLRVQPDRCSARRQSEDCVRLGVEHMGDGFRGRAAQTVI